MEAKGVPLSVRMRWGGRTHGKGEYKTRREAE